MTKKLAVVIFCDDFRVKDNPAFSKAVEQGYTIIPLFIYNENYQGRSLGGASKVFLYFILQSFSKYLIQKYNQPLVIRRGDYIEVLRSIFTEYKFEKIFFNNSYTETQIKVESKIKAEFNAEGFKAKLIFEPNEIREIKVFTPFWKQCTSNPALVGELILEPKSPIFMNISSLSLNDLELLPKQNWWQNLCKYWEFDYEKLEENKNLFFKLKVIRYQEDRNLLDKTAVSKFSPYIRFGVFSVKELFLNSIQKYSSFNSELGWREFAFHTLFRNQDLHKMEIKPEFGAFEWNDREDFLKKWQKGETGESIVDAGMQELWQTGYMHGRARMITASFLIKDLMIDWKKGEEWFWDCLVDACPAVNPFSWQWVFGSGYDSAPYFRIFNPILQQEKFDQSKEYTKKWLKKVFFPITSHEIQRKICLERYKKIQALKEKS